MGTSASAYLWWGFVFHRDNDEEFDDVDDGLVESLTERGEKRYLQAMGLTEPTDENGRSDAWNTWRAERKRIIDAGCEIVYVGYENDTTVIMVSASKTWAMDYGTEEVEAERMVAGTDWQERLDTFCKAVGIESKPGRWFLSAEWG